MLGAIASNIDIEKRIYQIYQKCRTDEEIQYQFNQLQDDMRDVLEVKEANARETLLNHFDRDVVATLKTRRDQSHDFLQEYERVLLDLAKAELPEANFGTNHFHYQGERYDLSWPLAQQHDSEFFRLQATEHFLAWELVHKAKERSLPPTRLTFYYDKLIGHSAALQLLIGQSGELAVFKLGFSYNRGKTNSHVLFVLARTDNGEQLSLENAEHLLCIPAQQATLSKPMNESTFRYWMNEIIAEQTLLKEEELDSYLEKESDKLERWANDRRQALMQTVEELDQQIRQFKKEARQLASAKEKIEAKKALRKLERKRDDALSEYHESKKVIEQEEDRLLDEVSEKLELSCTSETLFVARWTLNH